MAKKNGNTAEEPLEKQLWKAADKLRKNIDAAEYKHIALRLIFLKYISDAFEEFFAWLQHFIYHLSPSGQAGVVLAKGALTSKTSGEGEIRKALIEAGGTGLIVCIVNLPAKLFLNTQIPAALWL